jgi:3-oxosteroid 1-dehydrogenase
MKASSIVHDSGSIDWDGVADVVVVGAGAAGLPAAINAKRHGAEVLILEKAGEPGGTMKKSGAWYWIPNNRFMLDDGIEDDRDAFLRYVARLSRPQAYDPRDERLGLSEWAYDMVCAFYDNASAATDTLIELGAFKPLYAPWIPDYHSNLPEATVPYGRTLMVDRGDGEFAEGDALTAQLVAAVDRYRIPILARHRVAGVVRDEGGGVVGVRAATGDAGCFFGARQAVIFASGGFTHDRELRRNFLPPVVVSGCAAATNEGDFVHIATALGLPLRNMNFAWMAPMPLEAALDGDVRSGIFSVAGDSMIWVDKYGRRVVNEKAIYNELGMSFLQWDSQRCEYPRYSMMMIWDQRTMNEFASEGPSAVGNDGSVISEGPYLIRGGTLDELTRGISVRLERLAPKTGGFALDSSFRDNLASSIARFNEMAAQGCDLDFARGEKPIERLFGGDQSPGNKTANPTMYPISETGPYYATLVCAGTLDTKGGVVTNRDGQVLDVEGEPVTGLYAVGNCCASPSAQGYWAGGATIGPIFTFAYLASEHAVSRSKRSLSASRIAA